MTNKLAKFIMYLGKHLRFSTVLILRVSLLIILSLLCFVVSFSSPPLLLKLHSKNHNNQNLSNLIDMCTNARYITNRYTNKRVLVDCGNCPACQQQKATFRSNRIRNNLYHDEICLFVTLTYKNEFIPYISKCDIRPYSDISGLPIYRQMTGRYVRFGSGYLQKFLTSQSIDIIDHLVYNSRDEILFLSNKEISSLKGLRYRAANGKIYSDTNRVGVIYYPDVQNFYKRLRQNLKRHYNYDKSFSFFSCAEYGSYTQRPHFHLLLFIPKDFEQTFRDAIVESWPYADSERTKKYIEVARDCASYVSSYVNGNNRLPALLSHSQFKQKHSYSKTFGTGFDSFGLREILAQVDGGTCSYSTTTTRDGKPSVVSLPIPNYVINRYFPKFKGFSRVSPDSLFKSLCCLEIDSRLFPEIEYTSEDTRKIYVRLHNAYNYYHQVTGKNQIDYAIDFMRTYNVHASESLKLSYKDIQSPLDFLSFYSNALDFVSPRHPVRSFSLSEMLARHNVDLSAFETNPNAVRDRVSLTYHLEDVYRKMSKQKHVTNYAMAEVIGLDV